MCNYFSLNAHAAVLSDNCPVQYYAGKVCFRSLCVLCGHGKVRRGTVNVEDIENNILLCCRIHFYQVFLNG